MSAKSIELEIYTYVAYLIGITFSWETEHLLPNGEGASKSSLGLSIYYVHNTWYRFAALYKVLSGLYLSAQIAATKVTV